MGCIAVGTCLAWLRSKDERQVEETVTERNQFVAEGDFDRQPIAEKDQKGPRNDPQRGLHLGQEDQATRATHPELQRADCRFGRRNQHGTKQHQDAQLRPQQAAKGIRQDDRLRQQKPKQL